MITENQKKQADELFEKFMTPQQGRRIIEEAINWYERKAVAGELVFTPLFPMKRQNLETFSALVLLFQNGYRAPVSRPKRQPAALVRDGKLGPHTAQALKDFKENQQQKTPAAAFAFPIIMRNIRLAQESSPTPQAEPKTAKTGGSMAWLLVPAALIVANLVNKKK